MQGDRTSNYMWLSKSIFWLRSEGSAASKMTFSSVQVGMCPWYELCVYG